MKPDTTTDIINTRTASIPMDRAIFSVSRAVRPTEPTLEQGTVAHQIAWNAYYDQLTDFEDCIFVVTVRIANAIVVQRGRDALQLLQARGWVLQCTECKKWTVPSSESSGLCDSCQQFHAEAASLQQEWLAERRNEEVLSGFVFVAG